MTNFTETTVEQAALAWLEHLGYQILFGPEIARVSRWRSERATGRSCSNSGFVRRYSG